MAFLCDNCQLDGIYNCHGDIFLGVSLEVSLTSSSHKVKNRERREGKSVLGKSEICMQTPVVGTRQAGRARLSSCSGSHDKGMAL